MRFSFLAIFFLIPGCTQGEVKFRVIQKNLAQVADTISYEQLKRNLRDNRKTFRKENSNLSDTHNLKLLRDYWVNSLLKEFYPKWANTSWDYNGTTESPGKGSIACGYFVTTVLRDMDLKINRVTLAQCASSQMMKAVVPTQRLMNLSALAYPDFNKRISNLGKGVYIIGLDFHTGFIVNDGTNNWFVHSNFYYPRAVTKEKILDSYALKSSRTRWMICLTSDVDFLTKWLRN